MPGDIPGDILPGMVGVDIKPYQLLIKEIKRPRYKCTFNSLTFYTVTLILQYKIFPNFTRRSSARKGRLVLIRILQIKDDLVLLFFSQDV